MLDIYPGNTAPGNPKWGVVYLWIVLSPEEAFCTYISVFGRQLSRKSNNVVVFPFSFHIAVQQPFKPPWSCLLLNDVKTSQESFSLCLQSLLMVLHPTSEEIYRSSLLLGISLHLVPTLLTCPARETLLVTILCWLKTLLGITNNWYRRHSFNNDKKISLTPK